jgi:hypothetical protein
MKKPEIAVRSGKQAASQQVLALVRLDGLS